MIDSVEVLYVTENASVGERLEARFESDQPVISLSSVTDVDRAISKAETGRFDHFVVESGVAERTDLADAVPDADVEVHAVSEVELPTPSVSADRGPQTAPEQIELLAEQIERAVSPDSPAGESDARSRTDFVGRSFRALAEALSDAILVIEADSTVRFANAAVEDLFGYSPDELVGESLTKLMAPEMAEQHERAVQRYLREGRRHVDWNYVELPGRHRDGHEIPLAVSFSEFEYDGQRFFTGIARDVSQQKHRESELRTRIEQLDALTTFSQHALEDRPLDALMDEAVELVADVLDHDYCKVLEPQSDEDNLLLRAGVGWREGIVGSATVGTERDSQAGYTLLSEEPVVVTDLDVEDRFSGPELLTSHDVASGISTIIGPVDDPWGILGVHDTAHHSYADHDVQFVQNVAHLLATAIRRRERKRELERYETMLNAVSDGVYALDSDSRFVAVNDTYCDLTGYDREEILGKHASEIIGKSLYGDARWIQEALEEGEDAVTVDTTMTTASGESVPIEARVAPLPLDDVSGRVGVVRDVSERNRREEKLTSLNELLESLSDAESSEEVCDLGVTAAIETLGFQNAAIALYDDDANTLVPTVTHWRGGEIDAALLGDGATDVAWRAFVTGEDRVFADLDAELDAETEMASAIAVPLGKYGVFLAGSPEPEAFDQTDQSLTDMLCSNVRSALDRGEREEMLREQRNELEAKNQDLKRASRINEVIREITKALMRASSREDVMQAICDRLAETEPCRFAWFGNYDQATGEVHPQAYSGVEDGYLEQVIVGRDMEDVLDTGPLGRSVGTHEVQVENDLLGDPPLPMWRQQALERGYQSCACVPVVYDETLLGVLAVYGDEPGVFNEAEREVLSELGEFVGYALNALEQRQALVSEQSIELDFRVSGGKSPVLEFVSDTGGEFEFKSVVRRADGRLHAFFVVRGVPPEESLPFARSVSFVEDIRLVTDRGDEYLYDCTLGDDSFIHSLLDRGAIPQTRSAEGDHARFVVRVPQSANVRTFVDLFESYYDEVELVARREVDEPVMTQQEFESELTERLTERQREVLQMAYFSGYFEWPRGSTAQEIADALDVSQPTVSRHIRNAENTLFGLLFEEDEMSRRLADE